MNVTRSSQYLVGECSRDQIVYNSVNFYYRWYGKAKDPCLWLFHFIIESNSIELFRFELNSNLRTLTLVIKRSL